MSFVISTNVSQLSCFDNTGLHQQYYSFQNLRCKLGTKTHRIIESDTSYRYLMKSSFSKEEVTETDILNSKTNKHHVKARGENRKRKKITIDYIGIDSNGKMK